MTTNNPYTSLRERREILSRRVSEATDKHVDLHKEFNSKQELNAWDKKDAGHQIQTVLNKLQAAKEDIIGDAFVTESIKNKILASAMSDPDKGFKMVGQLIAEPIYDIVEYVGWSRKVLRTKSVSQGQVFKIPKDVDVVGWVIAGDGQTPVSQLQTKYVFPGRFKVTAFVEVDIADIVAGEFDVFKRGITKAGWEIARLEDVATYNLLKSVATTYNTQIAYATLGIGPFEDMRYQVERWRLTVDKFLIARSEVSDVVKTMSGSVDFVTERELILAGYIGNIFGAQVVTSSGMGQQQVIVPGNSFAITEGSYFGELGEMLPVTPEPYSTVVRGEVKKGYALYEIIGIGCGNAKAASWGLK